MRDVPDGTDVVEESRRGTIVRVRVQPRASRRGVTGSASGQLRIGVGAAPEGGRATEEARRVLARWLGMPVSHIRLISGASSRSKRFAVSGVAPDALRQAVAAGLRRNAGNAP